MTSDPEPVDPESVDFDDLDYIGAAERRSEYDGDLSEFENYLDDDGSPLDDPRIPVFEHPECDPYEGGAVHSVPGIRPDGTVVEFTYALMGAWDPKEMRYIWED